MFKLLLIIIIGLIVGYIVLFKLIIPIIKSNNYSSPQDINELQNKAENVIKNYTSVKNEVKNVKTKVDELENKFN